MCKECLGGQICARRSIMPKITDLPAAGYRRRAENADEAESCFFKAAVLRKKEVLFNIVRQGKFKFFLTKN